MLFTPFVTGLSVRERLLVSGPLGEAAARRHMRDVMAALAYLHANGCG